jgi:hypothetical protein
MNPTLSPASEVPRRPGTVSRLGPDAEHWKSLEDALAPLTRSGLFTVLSVEYNSGLVRRVYSNNEQVYACGGSKALMESPWAEHVIRQAKVFVASSLEDMRWAFADHEVLFGIGCTTAINVPIRQGSSVAWTVNILRGPPGFKEQERAFALLMIERWIRRFQGEWCSAVPRG